MPNPLCIELDSPSPAGEWSTLAACSLALFNSKPNLLPTMALHQNKYKGMHITGGDARPSFCLEVAEFSTQTAFQRKHTTGCGVLTEGKGDGGRG